MAGLHPIEYTFTGAISGIAATDADIPVRLHNGTYQKTVDDSRIDGKLIVAEKADSGKTPKLGTIEYMGIIRFKIADAITLDNAVLNRGVKGGANGTIKPVAYSSASPAVYDPNIVGRIIGFSNETGDKWIDVLMPAQ